MLSLKVNGKMYSVDVEPETPLLWVIRDTIGLTGTKYGCGIALCGSCTVHVNGKAVRSCVQPVSQVAGTDVTTIEGLSPNAQHPVQVAWRGRDGPAGAAFPGSQSEEARRYRKDPGQAVGVDRGEDGGRDQPLARGRTRRYRDHPGRPKRNGAGDIYFLVEDDLRRA